MTKGKEGDDDDDTYDTSSRSSALRCSEATVVERNRRDVKSITAVAKKKEDEWKRGGRKGGILVGKSRASWVTSNRALARLKRQRVGLWEDRY